MNSKGLNRVNKWLHENGKQNRVSPWNRQNKWWCRTRRVCYGPRIIPRVNSWPDYLFTTSTPSPSPSSSLVFFRKSFIMVVLFQSSPSLYNLVTPSPYFPMKFQGPNPFIHLPPIVVFFYSLSTLPPRPKHLESPIYSRVHLCSTERSRLRVLREYGRLDLQ